MTDINLKIYSRPEVAQHYATIEYLTPCEKFLFEKYIEPGSEVLDLGVGGGRTTPFLSSRAGRYAGVDYSPAMIEHCRQKFPTLNFFEADAADLPHFSSSSFDTVVMAFNGIDYLNQQSRVSCLRECHRVLKGEGTLIFSSHNPRAVLIVPRWNQQSVRDLALRVTGKSHYAFPLAVAVLSVAAAVRACLRSVWSSLGRMLRRLPTRAFLHGEGNMLDSSHGGLLTHYASPGRIVSEVRQYGFQLCEIRGDDYPARSHGLTTDWYYYVFAKSDTDLPG